MGRLSHWHLLRLTSSDSNAGMHIHRSAIKGKPPPPPELKSSGASPNAIPVPGPHRSFPFSDSTTASTVCPDGYFWHHTSDGFLDHLRQLSRTTPQGGIVNEMDHSAEDKHTYCTHTHTSRQLTGWSILTGRTLQHLDAGRCVQDASHSDL